jgi:tetratricopeptide (TPR) repeat protein
MGRIYLEILGRGRVAFVCLRQEIHILGQLERRREQVEALTDLALGYQELEKYGDALDAATEAIELAEIHGLARHAGVAHYNRGNCYATLEMWQPAENDYQRALEISEAIEDTELQEAVQNNLGEAYRRQEKSDQAVELLRSSLAVARQRGDIDSEIGTLNNLGLAYRALARDREALECFHSALDLSRQSYRRHEESNVLISLGNFYLEGDQPEKAKDYYDQALIAARATGDSDIEEGSILSLAYAHRQLGTFDSIAEDFKVIAERAGTLKHYANLAQMLTFAGEVNLEEGAVDVAAETFEQALIVALEIGHDRIQQFESRMEKPSLVPEFFQVFARICASVDAALKRGATEQARAFYDELQDRLRNLGEAGSWIADYLKPIRDYLAQRPERPIWEFLLGAWNDENHEPPVGSED